MTNAGCLTWKAASLPLPPDCVERCNDVPGGSRAKVYVFLLSGFDPLDLDEIAAVRATFQRHGFIKVYNGQFYHGIEFAKEMRAIRAEVPDARFAIVGYGLGVEAAAALAEDVAQSDIPVNLLASVDAPFWSSAPGKQPAHVWRV